MTNLENLQIEKMWVLSTGHLPQSEVRFLMNEKLPFLCIEREEGFIIHISDHMFQDIDLSWWVSNLSWLYQIVSDAKELDIPWLMLDCDGPKTNERFGEDSHVLPFFDW